MVTQHISQPGPAALPRVRIAVPSWFHALPMHRDPDERRRALFALAARMLPHGGPDQRRALAAWYDRQAVELSRYPVLYHGFSCLIAGGKVSMSSLLVGLEPGDDLNPPDAVRRLVARFDQATGPYQQVREYALPCGPAVVVLSGGAAPIPTRLGPGPDRAGLDRDSGVPGPNGSGSASERAVMPVAQAQAIVPMPGVPWLLVVRLTTPSLADWAEYCQVLVSLLRSVRFEQPVAA